MKFRAGRLTLNGVLTLSQKYDGARQASLLAERRLKPGREFRNRIYCLIDFMYSTRAFA